MEASSFTPEIASEEKGFLLSLQDKPSPLLRAGRDPEMSGQTLSGTHTSPSTHEMHVSYVPLASRACSKASEDFGFSETRHANGNGFKAPMPKRNPVSVGTVSSVLGKNYMWRSRSSGNSNGSKPLIVDAREFSIGSSTDHPSVSSNANSGIPNESAYRKDANYLNDDVENFLFEMLGRGFQIERSAIHEVLGRCGYDMKQSLETLLDLSAAALDKRNDLHKGSNLHSNSETFSSQNQVRKQKIAESSRFGNNVRSRQSTGRYEQQKEVLTALFRAPERAESTVTASSKVSGRRPRESGRVIDEPLEDTSDEHEAIFTIPPVAPLKVEAADSAYQILRKAVKEHRDTMKEYYRAATEAFANGDRARATVLMEKGRYFCNKAREADEESASKIFDISGDDETTEDDMSLDLQDHQAKEAIQLLKSHLRSLAGIPSIKNLKVMIGNGGRDAERRKRVVIRLLEREAIKWIEDESSNTILINLEEINPASLSFAKK